jgi:hypothetical protein
VSIRHPNNSASFRAERRNEFENNRQRDSDLPDCCSQTVVCGSDQLDRDSADHGEHQSCRHRVADPGSLGQTLIIRLPSVLQPLAGVP